MNQEQNKKELYIHSIKHPVMSHEYFISYQRKYGSHLKLAEDKRN